MKFRCVVFAFTFTRQRPFLLFIVKIDEAIICHKFLL